MFQTLLPPPAQQMITLGASAFGHCHVRFLEPEVAMVAAKGGVLNYDPTLLAVQHR